MASTSAAAGASAPKPRQRKLTDRVKAFLEVIRAEPAISVLAACKKAGYGRGRWQASKMERLWGQEIAGARVEGAKAIKLSAEEAEQIAAEIARDPTHRDRLKATEMFLRMHGKLSDKLQVTVDRATLNKQLDELIATMAAARAAERAVPNPQDGDALPKN